MEVIPRSMQSYRVEIRESAKSEFTTPQFRVLVHLTNRALSNTDLAKEIGVSVPAMSRMVDSLVRRGLLVRVRDKQDRRQVRLRVSADGQRKVDALRCATQLRFSDRFSQLDARRRRALADGLLVLEEIFGSRQ